MYARGLYSNASNARAYILRVHHPIADYEAENSILFRLEKATVYIHCQAALLRLNGDE